MNKKSKKNRARILRNKGRKVTKRLKKKNYEDQINPIITASKVLLQKIVEGAKIA